MSSVEFYPAAFIDLAEKLLAGLSGLPTVTSNLDQAKVRTSIGRSYFGTYLVAREKLLFLGKVTLTGGPQDHQLVVDALGGVGSELGSKLDRLRAKRNRADYNLNPQGFTLQSGRFWISIAQGLVKDLIALI